MNYYSSSYFNISMNDQHRNNNLIIINYITAFKRMQIINSMTISIARLRSRANNVVLIMRSPLDGVACKIWPDKHTILLAHRNKLVFDSKLKRQITTYYINRSCLIEDLSICGKDTADHKHTVIKVYIRKLYTHLNKHG